VPGGRGPLSLPERVGRVSLVGDRVRREGGGESLQRELQSHIEEPRPSLALGPWIELPRSFLGCGRAVWPFQSSLEPQGIMQPSSLLATALLAVSLALTVSALPSPASSTGCRAESATQTNNRWHLNCGTSSSCSSGASCKLTVSRDTTGDFGVCRCSDGSPSKCCQLILRKGEPFPETRGECARCGESGDCVLILDGATIWASCAGSEGASS